MFEFVPFEMLRKRTQDWNEANFSICLMLELLWRKNYRQNLLAWKIPRACLCVCVCVFCCGRWQRVFMPGHMSALGVHLVCLPPPPPSFPGRPHAPAVSGWFTIHCHGETARRRCEKESMRGGGGRGGLIKAGMKRKVLSLKITIWNRGVGWGTRLYLRDKQPT